MNSSGKTFYALNLFSFTLITWAVRSTPPPTATLLASMAGAVGGKIPFGMNLGKHPWEKK